ncbi:putative uncharacterized protein DDB_G0271606 [Dendronephthya gigantea]|uniref:putative uncharacterized protein DDB_G0271606 n=1 Tax=Dendronephthya gigantea TaxID=151771 RepID=UPI00106CAA87|nr:putative uncharacterized protein DDB_G0271606 [Dendronephthya gigantea]
MNEDTSLNRGESSKQSSNQAKDYFSKFTSNEMETFLSSSSVPLTQSDKNTPDDNVEKEETESPSTYDSLLLQQKRLLELQEEQRNQLVKRQQEQLLLLQQQQRQQQQQQQQKIILELQRTPENTFPEQDNEGQILPEGGVVAEHPNSLSPHELSEEDLSVVNMLLAEDIGTGLWTNEILDQPTSAS